MLDFEQLLSFFLQNEISFYFVLEFFEHDFLKKTAISHKEFEVEHDFLKAVLPMVILKLFCQHSNFIRFLNP